MDIPAYNRRAWNREVARGNPWTVPVTPDVVARAREGVWSVVLTPTKAVPRTWFPPLRGCPVLCLASGGGQQGPILAAAGARVTVFDNSDAQLARDAEVASRDELELQLVQGDMADLSAFEDGCFQVIFHPASNAFVEDLGPVWREAARVLRRGGVLMAGFSNPVRYLFDPAREEAGELVVRNALPYADPRDLPRPELDAFLAREEPLEFGHTLSAQIGGQLAAGLQLTDLFEDGYPDNASDLLSVYMESFIATRAIKP